MSHFVADGQQRLQQAYAEQYQAQLQDELKTLRDSYAARARNAPILTRAQLWLSMARASRKLKATLRDDTFGRGRLFAATGPTVPGSQRRDTNP